ncbi:MAG: hypothetical protein KGD64_03770 [Candidatus Heimdallarchaeota archaeon]|nr:hypothetical protein [Candidatus Heimdallarchaeota archaeon]
MSESINNIERVYVYGRKFGYSQLSFIRQFKDKWKHLDQAINNVPEDRFHEGPKDWRYYWIIYHIIETADFYSNNSPDLMKWGQRAGYDWKENSEEEIEEKKTCTI